MTATQTTEIQDSRLELDDEDDMEELPPQRKCLSAQEILGAEDGRFHWVPTPEWGVGCGVYVRTPKGIDRCNFEKDQASRLGNDKTTDFYERLIVMLACDESGRSIFTRDDVTKLREKAAGPIARIGDKCIALMGWSAADVEEIAKN